MLQKVSIIIPVYNVETLVTDCMDAIRKQTVAPYEVLFIDDASSDRSAEVIQGYIQQYELLHWKLYQHSKNKGVSKARNTGLENARGEWIFFMDSDDWLEPNAVEELLNCYEKHPADLVIGGVKMIDVFNGIEEDWTECPREYGILPENLEGLSSFEFCWGRLYRKSIIDKYDLRFDETIRYAEDNAWNLDYNQHIQSYCATTQMLYNYRRNRDGSLTKSLVLPKDKRGNWKHLSDFWNSFDVQYLNKAVSENHVFRRTVWDILSTEMVNNILDGDSAQAKKKLHSEVGIVVSKHIARSSKESVFLFLLKHSFPLFCIVVRLYYKNFEKIRNNKLFNRMFNQ